jgi:spermidine synthase
LFRAVQALSFLLPHASPALGFALDVALSTLLVLPPAILMGGTIPILTQALARNLDDATRFHALVYAFNTAGAFAGALAAGLWLVPSLGLVGVLVAMGVVNLVAGGIFLLLGLLRPSAAPAATAGTAAAPVRIAGFASLAAVALLTGFAMMTLQTVLIRLGGLSFGSSQFTFSMVVAVFVLCIALGSFAVSALPRIPSVLLPVALWTLLLLLGLLYAVADTAPYWAHALRCLYRDQSMSFYPYQLQAFFGVLLCLGLPVAISGAVLPLMFHALREKVTDLGDVAGRLYSWNTTGSLLGALIGGYALLFWLDLHHIYRIAMAAIAIAALLTTLRSVDVGWVAPAILLTSALAAIALLPPWAPERLSAGLFRNRTALPDTFNGPQALFRGWRGKLVYYDDDPVASIAVKSFEGAQGPDYLAIISNGKSDGVIPGDNVTTGLLALIPALIARSPARVFVVGFGTGVTAGELASLEETREVILAEISPAVIHAAPLFDYGNLAASKSPKLRIVQGDAYRTLLRSEGKFDLIVSEPSNPWVTGIEMLYSREFLEAARDRLNPGGVHAQWFHSYETDAATLALILRTYRSVFDHAAVWFTMGTDLLLLGLQDPEGALDIDRLRRRFERPDFKAGFERCKIDTFPALLAHEILPVGVLAATPLEGDLHTLLHPRLSSLAARAFFVGETGTLPATVVPAAAEIGKRNSLLTRFVASHPGAFDETTRLHVIEETCKQGANQCAPLLARWIVDTPVSKPRDNLRRRISLNQELARAVRLVTVDQLVPLFDGAPGERPAQVTPADAARASNLFIDFYNHAAPFSRAALASLWQRCEAEPKQERECVEARTKLEAIVGNLRK